MNNISVIGAGTMGNGIAHVFALCGYKVSLVDTNEEFLTKAINTITQNLERQAKKNLISQEDIEKTISNKL